MYGDFYVMTNRIWVTTENIYELFEKKSSRIYEEMNKNHIDNMDMKFKNLKIDDISHKITSIIPINEEMKIEVEDDTILDCSVEFQVDNSDLIAVDNKFDLFLVKDGDIDWKKFENKSFNYKVQGNKDQHSF